MKKEMQNRTKIKQKMVIEQLKSNGGCVKLSCLQSNVSRAQFYVWILKHEDFGREVEKVYNSINQYAKSRIYLSALKQDLDALLILKSQSEKKLENLKRACN